MYLSRILLDLSKWKTQAALGSPSKFHGAIEEAFQEKQDRNLWRIDALRDKTYLLLLSREKPDLTKIAEQFGYKDFGMETKDYDKLLERVTKDSVWQFRLVANPTHSVKTDGGRGKVIAHISQNRQLEWLEKKALKYGFSILPGSAFVKGMDWKIFYKQNSKRPAKFLEAAFEGVLKVENEELFKGALINGIGREKAYGMGLLTIIRARG